MIKNIVITSHVVYVGDKNVFGPGHAVCSFLENNSFKYVYIMHSLYEIRDSEIIKFSGKTKKTEYLKLPLISNSLIRYPLEMWATFNKYRIIKPDICIAIDPVNAFSAVLAKKAGFIKTVIYYTADYAEKRFANSLLNSFYHFLDRFALTNADTVWNVSSRILAKRRMQGIEATRNLLIPNSPVLSNFKKYSRIKRIPNSLVIMANFTPAIEYGMIIKVIAELSKEFKNLQINFVGTGELEEKVKVMVKNLKLDKHVKFHGFLSHDDALMMAAKSEIGLAPYSNNRSFTEFGDSLKAREYMALGLPVIISNNVSTSDDIVKYHAGFSIQMSKKELYKSIYTLLKNRKLYSEMQVNALKLARNYDLSRILNRELINKYGL